MADPGSIASQLPAGADWAARKIADLERQLRELGPSIAASFNSTVAHLASLTTTSAAGATFNTGPVPGDAPTIHWYDCTPPLTLAVTAATGHMLVTAGCGEVTLDPGNQSATAIMSFQASTPSGWTYALETVDARLFSQTSFVLGAPLIVSVPIVGAPTTEVITFTAKFGVKSFSATTSASANFSSPYLTVQVTN